ncbi:ribosomal protein L4 domain-containing protein [Lineolata rhizophorae]|uniref:Large ribosomal subunit protein uL4m n=1 Tax=Lineolata rhizophorae TaxID=578093 RepID=A0A6A6PE03_9PEZI|nr:ribosomal protein L4 domain-containing protein [Lineolata rhizophorae]
MASTRQHRRGLASEAAISHKNSTTSSNISTNVADSPLTRHVTYSGVWHPPTTAPTDTVIATAYRFPMMIPERFVAYSASHLHLPLRRDILHRAIVYEGDKTRQGTASSKHRTELAGSGRKIRPQKGMGMARLGDRKSPMLKGGGVAHGPHPRDFSTDLPRKVYDLAWRTALSYRFRRGQLVLVDGKAELWSAQGAFVRNVFSTNGWGRAAGRSLVITMEKRPNLFSGLQAAPRMGEAYTWNDVDVKDLLSMGRLIIEKEALDKILKRHQSDLTKTYKIVTTTP